jgi:hypothetical protein
LKAYKPLFEHLYSKFGGKHCKPGQKLFMMIDEFDSFVNEIGLINDLFPSREVPVMFNQAMQV